MIKPKLYIGKDIFGKWHCGHLYYDKDLNKYFIFKLAITMDDNSNYIILGYPYSKLHEVETETIHEITSNRMMMRCKD